MPQVADATIQKLLNEYDNPQEIYSAVISEKKSLINILNSSCRYKDRMTSVIEYTRDYDLERERIH